MSDSKENSIKTVISRALKMREQSYCPYSNYAVGACVECSDGTFYDGCNIENASYGLTVCAERVAAFKAISDYSDNSEKSAAGFSKKEIVRIAISGGKKGDAPDGYAYPCGACRQVLREFGKDSMEIIIAKSLDDYKITTLGEMLPDSFGPDHLKEV
ncbi:MAG: cytidine deaminase [Lachnospiraceae bacterium]|nr:cytidine deaminase [Lachnospiraceae bacterium]